MHRLEQLDQKMIVSFWGTVAAKLPYALTMIDILKVINVKLKFYSSRKACQLTLGLYDSVTVTHSLSYYLAIIYKGHKYTYF